MKLSLVIPAFNEATRLPRFLDSIVEYLQHNPLTIYEIIIVNDGSSDNTVSVATNYRNKLPRLKIISHPQNRGKGAAVQTGVLAATGDCVVFMDADGATPITELPKMMDALTHAEIGIGNRWLPGAHAERHSGIRQLSGWVYRTYMRLFGLGRIDTMCGFKGYRQTVARDLFQHITAAGWLFDTEVAYRAIQRGYSVRNFPIKWTSQDGSKLSTHTLLTSALRILPLVVRIHREEKMRRTSGTPSPSSTRIP